MASASGAQTATGMAISKPQPSWRMTPASPLQFTVIMIKKAINLPSGCSLKTCRGRRRTSRQSFLPARPQWQRIKLRTRSAAETGAAALPRKQALCVVDASPNVIDERLRPSHRTLGTTSVSGRRSAAVPNSEKLWFTKFTTPEICFR